MWGTLWLHTPKPKRRGILHSVALRWLLRRSGDAAAHHSSLQCFAKRCAGPREGSAQQDALADREAPAESPRQRKRALDSPQPADARAPLRSPGSFAVAPAPAPASPYGRGSAQNGALPLGMPEVRRPPMSLVEQLVHLH